MDRYPDMLARHGWFITGIALLNTRFQLLATATFAEDARAKLSLRPEVVLVDTRAFANLEAFAAVFGASSSRGRRRYRHDGHVPVSGHHVRPGGHDKLFTLKDRRMPCSACAW